MFAYKPIHRESSEIRLVRFIEPADTNAPIQLELRHASLDDIQYAALSYVWGDVTDTAQISIDGHPFAIGHNLHAGLKQLRDNGSDLDEKTWQVGQMRAIFSGAVLVYVWLGPGSDESDEAMDLVARVGPRALAVGVSDLDLGWLGEEEIRAYVKSRLSSQRAGTAEDEMGSYLALFLFDLLHEPAVRGSDSLTYGILDIMQRDYWHRIWIIQEVSLARNAIVLCGAKNVSLDIFDATFEAVLQCCGMRMLSPEINDFAELLSGVFYEDIPLPTRYRHRHQREVSLASVLVQTTVAPNRPFYSATDPRDICFGLLGVITNVEQLGLSIDYNLSFVEVFTTMTRALINDGRGFRLDWCTPREENPDGSPSWVPDWREIGKYGVELYPISYGGPFNAAVGMPAPPQQIRFSNDDKIDLLRRAGCRVDVVIEVMRPPRWIQINKYTASAVADTETWLASIVEFAKLGPNSGPGEDYVWKTVMRDELNRSHDRYEQGPVDEDGLSLIRSIMRRETVDAQLLTRSQREFIQARMLPWSDADTLDDKLVEFERDFVYEAGARSRERTLFKTVKGMFGLGHVAVREGDVVTLLWGLESPIILRPRSEGVGSGFTFVGDAYVDGIMNGEFLATLPVHDVFDIY
ncbi:hypothetical protein QQX98_008116 [Neonectria punicea]|uniref:Heterokaryon incompatibility domain-containing protein n=1 Tax=Neonectria punicea TaxID=979145 RepID=A0ABR1GX32_9HYPO